MSRQTIEVEVPDYKCPGCGLLTPAIATRLDLKGAEWKITSSLMPVGWGYASDRSVALYCGDCLKALDKLLTANGFADLVRNP